MNLNLNFTVPADATLGDTRIRVIYNSAWEDAPSANSIVLNGGMAYDFPVKVTEYSAINEVVGDNASLYYNDGLICSNSEEALQIYDLTGKLVRRADAASVAVDDLANGVYKATKP